MTWSKLSSTGVSRSNSDTSTMSLPLSGLISLIVPGRPANEPSLIVIVSPASKSISAGIERAVFAEVDLDLELLGRGLGDLHGRLQHVEGLVEAQRRRVVGVAHEARDAGRVAHDGPAVLVEVHADEHVAGDAHAVDELPLAVLDLDHVLHGDLHLVDALLHVHGDAAVLDVRLHALLEARVGVHDVPLAGLDAQLALELVVGVDLGGLLLGVLGGILFGLVLGRLGGGLGLLGGVDVEGVLDDRVGLGVGGGLERVEQVGEVGLVLVHDVHRGVLGGVGRVLVGLEGVALLRLVLLGGLLGSHWISFRWQYWAGAAGGAIRGRGANRP